ncbi:hypothetical protein [Pedobacter zeae]|uniref:Uncharacterized protein n=1 Tax=Pedobacter zeae TaxID=1737356 RepID=A0A7W6P6X1_9SPHI|nr:hypothetical protein [Pedobacter zeae]MBB4108339.1 hypothetical protein [Pedobacter zeae]GGG93440.1 hypothetical protein GCM10007422_03340 [Pedobacter zeae]
MNQVLIKNGFVLKHYEPINGMSKYEKENVEIIENTNIYSTIFYTANIKYTAFGCQRIETVQNVVDISHLNESLNKLRAKNSGQVFIDNLQGKSLYDALSSNIKWIVNSSRTNDEKVLALSRMIYQELECISTQYAAFVKGKGLTIGSHEADIGNFYKQYYNYGVQM